MTFHARVQFSVGKSGNEGLSELRFAMIVMYRTNLHKQIVRHARLTITTDRSEFTVFT